MYTPQGFCHIEGIAFVGFILRDNSHAESLIILKR